MKLGGGHKHRKSAEKGHFIPFFLNFEGAKGRRGFNSAISYIIITTVISTCIIHKHRDFDLFFSSSFEKVINFSKLELKNKSKSLWLYIKRSGNVVIYEITELNPLRPSGPCKIDKNGIKWPFSADFLRLCTPPKSGKAQVCFTQIIIH